MTWTILAITLYVIWASHTGSLEPVREVIPYYDMKHECDIREWWRVSDKEYIADCDGFYLVFDTDNILRWRVRKTENKICF